MTVNTEQQLGHTVARERDSLQTTYVKFKAHEGGTRPAASFYVAHKTSTHVCGGGFPKTKLHSTESVLTPALV